MSVYFIRSADIDLVKIGSATEPQKRLAALQTGCPGMLTLERVLPGGRIEERALHAQFAARKLRGEWYRLSPREVATLWPPEPALDVPDAPATTPKRAAVASVEQLAMRDARRAFAATASASRNAQLQALVVAVIAAVRRWDASNGVDPDPLAQDAHDARRESLERDYRDWAATWQEWEIACYRLRKREGLRPSYYERSQVGSERERALARIRQVGATGSPVWPLWDPEDGPETDEYRAVTELVPEK